MIDINNFDSIRIGLASPKQIEAWSKGEVTKPETINYRTLKPERDGLFCERIFGPTKDWECYCGKYKRVRYKGIICERCGVEVTRAKVRRERMGHIKLAAPVSHIWFFKGVPSRMGYLLDIAPKELEKVLYFGGSYVVISVDKERRDGDLVYLQEKIDELKARYDEYAERRSQAIRDMHAELVTIIDGERDADDFHRDSDPEDEFGYFNYFDIFESYRRIAVNAAALGPDELKQQRAKADKLRDDYIDKGFKHVEEAKVQIDKAWERFKTVAPREVIGEEPLYQQMERMFGREPGYEPESFGVYFTGGTGAEAVRELLKRVDLEAEAAELRETIHTAKGQRQARAVKRLKVVSAFLRSGNHPEWMILDVVPVIPPELRPMVQLDGGRFATSDLNDLYRRVINRNNRLKRLLDLQAPDIIVNNEKRMLQEAVDALFDNGRRGRAVTGPGNRPLKSLSDMLKGKQGRFRQNLLGKRVDYSGRSVIVAGPHLKMHQCGLPKMMALELFKPFIMSRLVNRKMVQNIKAAKKMVESMVPEVWDILEEVITEHPVMLNRAPTLHRLGIQAFEPLLVEGKAIQIHPLVCAAFNADFDGDQMAVHLPLSWEAQAEARVLMLSTNNILSPAHGKPVAVPSQDMVIGIYYLTYHEADDLSEATPEQFGDGKLTAYSSYDEVLRAWEQRILDQREVPTKREQGIAEFTRSPIRLRLPTGRRVVTTVGRALFNMEVEEGLRAVLGPEYQGDYTYINYTMTKKGLASFINKLVALYGANKVARILDVFKEVGFHFATRAAVTVSKNDVVIPEKEKAEILTTHERMVEQIQDEYNNGFLSEEERRGKVQEIWREADVQITTAATKANFKPLNPIYMMATSGARGDIKQIRQLAGWRGQMSNPKGEIVEQPVKSSFIEGLTVLEFFISTHGARKGLADTALRTADSGYLTRRLVDVCQDVTVAEEDCGTEEWVPMSPWSRRREENPELDGTTLAEDVKRPRSDRVVLKKGETIGPAQIGLLREVYSTLPNAKVKVKRGRAAAESMAVWTHEPNENLLGRHLGTPIVDEATGEVVFERDAHIGLEARVQSPGRTGAQLRGQPHGPGAQRAQVPGRFRRVPEVLRVRPGQQRARRDRRRRRAHRRAVHRRARHPAHHAHVPHRRHRRRRHHARPSARRRALRGAQAQGRGAHRRSVRPRVHRGHRARLQGHPHTGRRRGQGIHDRLASHERHGRGRRLGGRGHAAHARLALPGRPAQARRGDGHRALPRQRGAGGLPLAGRGDQRQAHRAHRPPDDEEGPPAHRRRHRVPARSARGPLDLRAREPARERGGRAARRGRGDDPRHHQGLAGHGELPLGGLLPGDHQGAHRCRHRGQGRHASRPQGEHHHRQAHPRRHGSAPLPRHGDLPRRQGRSAGRGRPPHEQRHRHVVVPE